MAQRLATAHSGLVRHRQRAIADARRRAILKGLSELGYEVREGMETAWADSGRVVLKKPSLPGYGVEIGGAADATRLQVRAVALSAGRDTGRDRDVETIWCGDFGKLQVLISDKGGAITIEKSVSIGASPLKVLDAGEVMETAATSATLTRKSN